MDKKKFMVLTRQAWSENEQHPLQGLYDLNLKNLSGRLCATIGDGVEVHASNIPDAGDGLFATRAFLPGEVVTGFSGTLMQYPEARTLNDPSHTRTLVLGYLVVDGARKPQVGLGGGSFANDGGHTLVPNNCAFKTIETTPGLPTLVLVALGLIETGAEILVSYGRSYWYNR